MTKLEKMDEILQKLTKLQICRSEKCDVRALKKVLINLEIERIKEQCAGA